MNLKLIYVSVVAFGVAGLIVFTYLQTYIEDQHTGVVFMHLWAPRYLFAFEPKADI
uniref:Uncharacterized protein n=1 Tax=Laticauda laticaudata TaxID=8630 RepID=A0A8C5S2A9_LATLA